MFLIYKASFALKMKNKKYDTSLKTACTLFEKLPKKSKRNYNDINKPKYYFIG